MPLFFQQDIDADTRLAIWHIAEEEDFYLNYVPLQRAITHPHKRLQHLAGRYLLQYLFPDFPIKLIQIADTRKPFLQDEAYHFSISHCGDYAAVLVSKTRRVGVDIELFTDKIKKIQHKFVAPEEWPVLEAQPVAETLTAAIEPLTLLWSCKEAVFKWYGLGNVNFQKHMQLQSRNVDEAGKTRSTLLFKKNEDQLLDLHSQFFPELCLSYLFT